VQFVWRWALKLGLWPRVALGVSLGFLALFAAVSAIGELALRDSANRLLNERLVIAQMAASQIDNTLQEATANLSRVRRFADFDPTDPNLSDEIDVLTHTYGRSDTFASGIIFLDTTGRVVLAHPLGLYPTGSNLATLPHVAAALTHREATISAPFREAASRWPVVAVTIPIYNNSRFVGLLSGLINLEGPAIIDSLQQAATLEHTGHAVLTDGEGRVLVSTFDLPFLSPGEHASFYRRAMAGGQPVVETVPFELTLPQEPLGHLHVMAFAPLRTAPWGVAVGGDIDETFAGVNRLRFGLALLSLVALIGIWTATLVGTRRLVRPVQNLTEAAQRIANGDLHTPLQAAEGGEIGAMAAALEQMRRLLLANIEQLAHWNETLEARVARRTEELHRQQALVQQLLHKTITAQEEERARLSRELHDEVGQTITAVQISLDRLAQSLPPAEPKARERLEQTRALTEHTLTDLRRIIAALRPGILDQLGLVPALNWVADHTLRPQGLTVTIETDNLHGRLPDELEIILFRIAQEAMNNVARHSRARRLEVHLQRNNSQMIMALIDDGYGFNLSEVTSDPSQGRGLGLAGMQERASLVGGWVKVESAPGQGTTVQVTVPVLATVNKEKNRQPQS